MRARSHAHELFNEPQLNDEPDTRTRTKRQECYHQRQETTGTYTVIEKHLFIMRY